MELQQQIHNKFIRHLKIHLSCEHKKDRIKKYNNLITLINKRLFKVRKAFNQFRINIVIKHKHKYLYYSDNLDVTTISYNCAEKIRHSINSYANYKSCKIYSPLQQINTQSYTVTVNETEYTYFISPNAISSESDYNGFYFWTYGVYGFNETLTIDTTNAIKAQYNLFMQPSTIIWWPEPPYVQNTYCGIPNNLQFTVAFSGYIAPGTSQDSFSDPTCLGQANGIYSLMVGDKYVCIGGGTVSWTVQAIDDIISAINTNQFKNYQGLCFDIEVGDPGLSNNFNEMFKAAKSVGLLTMASVSHTAPYGFSDGNAVMQSIFQSAYIDVISTQLYTFDFGTANEYNENAAVSWNQFKQYYSTRTNPNLLIIPSIFSGPNDPKYGTYDLYSTGGTNEGLVPINYVDPNYQVDTGSKNFYSSYGINTSGYIQWINGTLKPL